jgi:hypothetical protein
MPIDELVKMARSYGNAIGNEQKAAETFGADDLGDEIAKQYVKKGKSKEEAQKIGDATAYKVGVAKYGKKGMAKKAQAGKKSPAKKAPAKKTPAKKTPAKKTPAKKAPAKKAPAKKAPAKKKPTVFALTIWVQNTEPYKSAQGWRRRALEEYLPKGDYKITASYAPDYYTTYRDDVSKWEREDGDRYYYGYSKGEYVTEGSTINFAGISRLHYDTNVAFDIPTYKYKGQPYSNDDFSNAIWGVDRNNKRSHLPYSSIPHNWEYLGKPPVAFTQWYSQPANKKLVEEEYHKKYILPKEKYDNRLEIQRKRKEEKERERKRKAEEEERKRKAKEEAERKRKIEALQDEIKRLQNYNAETFEADYNVPKPEVMPSFMGWYAKQPKKWQRNDMKRRLDGIWREGDRDEVSIKHIYYSLGALGAGRDWHTQTDYGFEMNKIDMVQKMWWPIQAIRDEIGLDNFKELVLSIPNYGEAFEQFEFTLPDGEVIKGDGWSNYKSESFEAEMDKVVDVDCVNIVSKKSAFTGKDRNFYRVSFRDAGQYDRFGIPAWAARAAETMGTKYYGVSGCKMVMGMLPSGKWQIQAILIPNTQKMNKQKALKIANHMQDRIEKEGQWARKKCRENEIIEIYQAEEYGAESSNFVNPRELVDEEKGEYGIMYLRGGPDGRLAKFLHLDCPLNQNLEDIGTSPYFADEGEIHFYEPDSPIGECYTCGKNVKLSDEDFDFMTSWYEDYDSESYEAERIQYNYVVHRHPKGSSKGGWFKSKKAETFYDAETFSTKPAYGLFGLSFITGLFVNFARKR